MNYKLSSRSKHSTPLSFGEGPGVRLLFALLLSLFGIALIIAAFAVPPTGIIHPSVLTAYGETLTFAGALFGIDCRYRSRNNNPKDNKD